MTAYNKWTDGEIRFLRYNYGKVSRKELCSVISTHSYDCIKTIAYRLGLTISKSCFINEKFFDEWSEEMAWCLGIVATDGSLTSVGYKTIELSVTDKELIYKFVKFMGSTYHVSFIDRSKEPYLGRRHRNTWRTKITRPDVYDSLVDLGIKPNKSLDLKFPEGYPDKWMPGYIRGVVDGDGCVQVIDDTISISSSSESYIYGLDDFLVRELDLSGHTVIRRKPKCIGTNYSFILRLCGNNAYKLGSFIYHDCMGDAYLDRKYKAWMKFRRVIVNDRHKKK